MSLAVVHSRAQSGVSAPPVTVEVHLSGGLPGTSIVGLPETAVKEARDRVRVAIQNAQIEYPSRRVTVSLAPADLPKDGGRFDLPIALGILAASGHLPKDNLAKYEFIGELALSGELRGVTGVLPAALKAARAGRTIIVPSENGAEAGLAAGTCAHSAHSLLDVCAFLKGMGDLPSATSPPMDAVRDCTDLDLADVRGQPHARRALEIAAAGNHHALIRRPARHRQNHAREPPARHPAAADRIRSARSGGGAFRCRLRHRLQTMENARVSHAASHRVGCRAGRRRLQSATGRNFARASRCSFPRRTPRVRPPRTRRTSRTARIRTHRHIARRAAGGISRKVPARRGDESVSLRLCRRSLRAVFMLARCRATLSRPRIGSACSIASICKSRCLA